MTDYCYYGNFEKSLAELKKAIDRWQENPENKTHKEDLFQSFRLTYKEANKVLDIYLRDNTAKGIGDVDSVPNLIRWGARTGMLQNSWDKWHEYYSAFRKVVSHPDEKETIAIIPSIKEYCIEATYFLNQMKKRGV